jgi:peptidoglycan/LPS O-acetylase OafA/YrhL
VNESAVAPASEPPGRTLGHVGALDGLRGVAVLVVVVYHLSPQTLPGGFLGVSLFFTLSGFLITNLLLVEWQRSRSIDLRRFWGRRFRRLLPAALAGVALVLVLAWASADADQLSRLRGDVLASLGYVANWRFILGGDLYGAGYQAPSPLLHYWSLAIEEQFYIVVAVVALFASRFTGGRRTWFLVFGALAALSMLATVLLAASGAPTTRIYFGSDTRAFELLAGVLLAVVVGFGIPRSWTTRRWRHALWLAAGTGVLVSYFLVGTEQRWLYRGGLWLVALGSVAMILASLDTGPVSRVLSWRPFMALGLISYGIYVYHWPIFLWLDRDTTGIDGLPLAALRLSVTLVASLASYRFLEQPIRRRHLTWRPAAAAGALGIAGLVLIAGVDLLGRQAAGRAIVAESPDIQLSAPTALTVPSPATTAVVPRPPLQRVLFIGDSLVHQAWPTVEDRLSTGGIEARVLGGEGEHLLSGDGQWLEDLREEIKVFDPDLVVLESCCGWGSPWKPDESYRAPDGTVLEPDSDEAWTEWDRMARAFTEVARRDGRAVMWLLAPPARTNGYYGPVEGRIGTANAIYERLAQCTPGVGLLDWRVIAAPDGSFTWTLPDAAGNEVQVRHSDGLHFSPEGQAVLADFTRDVLRSHWQTVGGRRPTEAPACPT